MKYQSFIYIIIVGLLLTSSCQSSSENHEQQEVPIIINETDIVTKAMAVDGMTCVGCEITLEDNISKIKGVVSVKASHTKKEAIITFDSTKTNLTQIAKTIKKAGYQPFYKK